MIHLPLYIGHNISCNCRDFQKVDEILLTPIIEALGPVGNISVESQVSYGFSPRGYTLLFTFIN